jgi:hypothetical protein
MVLTRSQTHENPHLDDVEGQDDSVNSQLPNHVTVEARTNCKFTSSSKKLI